MISVKLTGIDEKLFNDLKSFFNISTNTKLMRHILTHYYTLIVDNNKYRSEIKLLKAENQRLKKNNTPFSK